MEVYPKTPARTLPKFATSNVTSIAPSEVFAELAGDRPPLIEPGQYDLKYSHHQTHIMFGRSPKLVLWFKVLTMGQYFDTLLPRYYNVVRLTGKPARNGGFKVGFHGYFYREYCRIFSGRLPRRTDRIPMSAFEKVIIIGRVKTVVTGRDQSVTPDELQYSVIEELMAVRLT